MKDRTIKQVQCEWKVNEGDLGECIELMNFIYLCEKEQTFCNCFNRVGRGLRVRDDEGNVTNLQYKPIQNCYYESPHVMYIR
jgi:hypothetical protein